MYDLPSRGDIGEVVIGLDTVVDRADPTLVPRGQSASGPRRAAS